LCKFSRGLASVVPVRDSRDRARGHVNSGFGQRLLVGRTRTPLPHEMAKVPCCRHEGQLPGTIGTFDRVTERSDRMATSMLRPQAGITRGGLSGTPVPRGAGPSRAWHGGSVPLPVPVLDTRHRHRPVVAANAQLHRNPCRSPHLRSSTAVDPQRGPHHHPDSPSLEAPVDDPVLTAGDRDTAHSR
jgi:hypothetical protein